MNVPGFKSISFTLLVFNSLFFLLGIFLSFQGLLLSALSWASVGEWCICAVVSLCRYNFGWLWVLTWNLRRTVRVVTFYQEPITPLCHSCSSSALVLGCCWKDTDLNFGIGKKIDPLLVPLFTSSAGGNEWPTLIEHSTHPNQRL